MIRESYEFSWGWEDLSIGVYSFNWFKALLCSGARIYVWWRRRSSSGGEIHLSSSSRRLKRVSAAFDVSFPSLRQSALQHDLKYFFPLLSTMKREKTCWSIGSETCVDGPTCPSWSSFASNILNDTKSVNWYKKWVTKKAFKYDFVCAREKWRKSSRNALTLTGPTKKSEANDSEMPRRREIFISHTMW